ncbi:hypothetical protein B0H19DRAFT_1081278 [Mycena capillaripes]|nr:hypothetical protein B0H19DRAFT_1081278 [Mycena capillaripes]
MYLTLVHATGSEPITAFPPPVDGPTSTFGYVRLRPPTSVHVRLRHLLDGDTSTFGYVRLRPAGPGHYLFGRAPSQYLKSSNIVHAELRCKSNFRSTVRGPKKEGN